MTAVNFEFLCPLNEGDGENLNYETLVRRARELGAIDSPQYLAELVEAQKAGEEIFPVESRGQHYFVVALTGLTDEFQRPNVAGFFWSNDAQRWVEVRSWNQDDFNRQVRVLVPAE